MRAFLTVESRLKLGTNFKKKLCHENPILKLLTITKIYYSPQERKNWSLSREPDLLFLLNRSSAHDGRILKENIVQNYRGQRHACELQTIAATILHLASVNFK